MIAKDICMEKIRRFYLDRMDSLLQVGKVLVLYGPRRAGKTTLINDFLATYKSKYFYRSGEDRTVREVFQSDDVRLITSTFSGYDLVVIDEAQAIPHIGQGLKILVDSLPGIKVLASGSSSFDLANQIGEPLTGRKRTITLYPVSAKETAAAEGNFAVLEKLNETLVFGSYPEIMTTRNREDKIELLHELRDSYLFKDILSLEGVKKPDLLIKLLTLLAFQVGKQVSLNELSIALGTSKITVARYLELLEKCFVIFAVSGFSRNLRSEVTKMKRYYFYDNGILNSLTNNFNMLSLRMDAGALWENYLVCERIKKQAYDRLYTNNYFWRTYKRQEIDWVEERDGRLSGFEFKWGSKIPSVPPEWREAYPDASFTVVNRSSFLDFIL